METVELCRGDVMVRWLLGLSSGTLSRLFNTTIYSEIDAHFERWCCWVEAHAGPGWATWLDCWAEYKTTLENQS